MILQTNIPSILIAPCGMNCGICMAYLRDKNRCAGCNIESPQKSNHCLNCRIKNCAERTDSSQFCFSCEKYPCARLRQIDNRYWTKYSWSLIGNLDEIRDSGIVRFMEKENTRWVCPKCGNPICIHNRKCYHCGEVTLKSNN